MDEDMAALVESSGWNRWLGEVVFPAILRYQEKLLRQEDLPEVDRKALIRLLKELRGIIRAPYELAGFRVPRDLE